MRRPRRRIARGLARARPNLYIFGLLSSMHDMFSGFDYQAGGSVGLGYKMFDTATTRLGAQVAWATGSCRRRARQ